MKAEASEREPSTSLLPHSRESVGTVAAVSRVPLSQISISKTRGP